MDTSKVSRFEVIDHSIPLEEGGGRTLVLYGVRVEAQLQDEGRTLKIFIK
jgi:hypothetical protein